jgi:hypothetical protein
MLRVWNVTLLKVRRNDFWSLNSAGSQLTDGGEVVSLPPCNRLEPWLVVPAPDDGWWVWSSRWNEWQGKPEYSQKPCPSAALSTTNPIRLYFGSNPGRRGGSLLTSWVTARPGVVSLTRSRALPRCLVLVSVRGWVNPQDCESLSWKQSTTSFNQTFQHTACPVSQSALHCGMWLLRIWFLQSMILPSSGSMSNSTKQAATVQLTSYRAVTKSTPGVLSGTQSIPESSLFHSLIYLYQFRITVVSIWRPEITAFLGHNKN